MASTNPTTTLGSTNVGHWSAAPIHYRRDSGYIPEATAFSAGAIQFEEIAGLRWSFWRFENIAGGDTWDTSSTVPPPDGAVVAAWIPDIDDAGGIGSVRITGARTIAYSGGTGDGWIAVGSR